MKLFYINLNFIDLLQMVYALVVKCLVFTILVVIYLVHYGGVKIKDFLENMTPLFNEIVIFKSEKFRFKKREDLESCKSCKFSSYGRLFYCCLHWYNKSYNWNCGILGKKALSGFYDSYV